MEDLLETAKRLANEGKYEEAIPHFREVGGAPGAYGEGACYKRLGQKEKAADALRRCLAIDPEHAKARKILKSIYSFPKETTPQVGDQEGSPDKGLALASLVCAIGAFPTCGLSAIPAVICGHLAMARIKKGQVSGSGMALASLIIGYAFIAFMGLGVIAGLFDSHTDQTLAPRIPHRSQPTPPTSSPIPIQRSSVTPAIPVDFWAKCSTVTDGDTIKVLRGFETVGVRLNGIDCPEGGQPYGLKAKGFTSDMVVGKEVGVKVHGKDRYGRTIADVYLPDGRCLNQELVAVGLAWWYREYSTDASLANLEREAALARLGLWTDYQPVAPWDYRDGKRSASLPKHQPATPRPPSGALIPIVTNGARGEIVYITPKGERYHCTLECMSLIRSSQIDEITVPEAKSMGRTPCGLCYRQKE